MILSALRRPHSTHNSSSRLKYSMFVFSVFVFSCFIYVNLHFQYRVKSFLLDVTTFTQYCCHWPVQTTRTLINSFLDHLEVYEKNKKLQVENYALRAQYHHNLALMAENRRLREKLKIIKEIGHSFISVRVLGRSNTSYQHSLFLAGGENESIQIKSPVLAGRQVLGRVIQTGHSSCKVLLITDLHSHVPIIFEKSGVNGILSGENSEIMKVKIIEKVVDASLNAPHLPEALPSQRAKIQVGEYVFTSGSGGIFPPGFIVGRVVEVTPHEISVRSTIDIAALEYVQVTRAYEGPPHG
jgi:rod shape-determining protein MreC